MALPARRPDAPVALPSRTLRRPTLYADCLETRPIVVSARRGVPRNLIREVGRLAYLAVVLGGPIIILLKALS